MDIINLWNRTDKRLLILLVIGLSILFMFIENFYKFLIYTVLILITGTISYTLAAMRSPVDVSPTFFLAIIISNEYSLLHAGAFVILASIIPSILAGGEISGTSALFFASFMFICIISGIFLPLGLVLSGIILVGINMILSFFINNLVGWEGGFIFSSMHGFIQIMYFVAVGNTIISIIGATI